MFSPILIAGAAIWFFFFRGGPNGTDNNGGGGNGSATNAVNSQGSVTIAGSTPAPVRNSDGSIKITSTISRSQAQGYARQLYDRLYMDVITVDSQVFAIFKGLNSADYALIFDAFGVKGSGLFGLSTDLNLTEWIVKDVGDATIAKLKKQFPGVF